MFLLLDQDNLNISLVSVLHNILTLPWNKYMYQYIQYPYPILIPVQHNILTHLNARTVPNVYHIALVVSIPDVRDVESGSVLVISTDK